MLEKYAAINQRNKIGGQKYISEFIVLIGVVARQKALCIYNWWCVFYLLFVTILFVVFYNKYISELVFYGFFTNNIINIITW